MDHITIAGAHPLILFVLPAEDRKLPSLVACVLPISAGESLAKTDVCSSTCCIGVEGVYSLVTTPVGPQH